jgi:hypothetical protein
VDLIGAGEAIPFIGWIFVFLLLGVMVFFVLPIAVFLVELVIFLGVMLLAAVVRTVFRRPWIVEASSDRQEMRWRVVGWGASRRTVIEVAQALERGERTPQPMDAEAETS